jgi:chromate transport protein ChrA
MISLRTLGALYLRAGNLTFGGGDVITATLQRELVHMRGWLTMDQYGLAQSLAKVTPGTGSLAFCAATAWMLRRWAGAVVAVLVASLPPAVFVVLLTWGFTAVSANRPGRLVLATVLASAVGMMWAGAWLLIRPQLSARTWLRTVVLAAAGFLALGLWSVSPIQILIGAALVGAIWIDEMGGPEMAPQAPHPRSAPASPGRSSTSRG